MQTPPPTPMAEAHPVDALLAAGELPPTPKGPILATAPVPELPRLLGHLRPTPNQFQPPQATKPSSMEKMFAEKANADWTSPEVEAPTTPASEPAKVLMPGYDCEVPNLDPLAPVKKRVPEWSL
mmetsp:Transcript_1570/g.4321  ORF Transcript_1570/g.4321 Transcript_1570/m.4321 type:complete len:124 (-) Transcript_1570:155-526(-)